MSAWLVARVAATRPTSATARVVTLDVPGWPGSEPGQHLDVRLTAEDGYQAERAYSMSSSGPGPEVEIAVDEVPDGEVSPYLVGELRVGDGMDVKGPLGRYFVWDRDDPAPVQLIAGGSGIVPLVAIARARSRARSGQEMRLLASVRTPEHAMFAAELGELSEVAVRWHYTRAAPPGWPGTPRRLTEADLAAATLPPSAHPVVFVCGPTPFVEAAADAMVALGHPAARIRTERFGGAA